jgi:Predicted Zn-dependent peptidases
MYTKDILKNGIRIVTEYIPYVNSVSIGVWVANGSRNEDVHNNGMSHFIEHMMFKGTEKRSARDIAEDIEEIGGQINAFTGKEATCYYIKVLDSHLNIAVDVLSDMLLNSRMDEEDIEKEKGVILEEINMYEDSPEDLVTDLLSKAAWPQSSIGYPILGEYSTLKEFSRDRIIDYMNKQYTTENIVVSVVGNFDYHKLYQLVDEKLRPWNVKGKRTGYDQPALNRTILTKSKDIEQIHLSFGLNGIETGNDDLYTLLAVNNIFGGGTSSRLFQKIREERGLAYSIYSYPSSYNNAGMFTIYVGLTPQYTEEVSKLILNEISEIREKGITEEQLYKSKEQLKGNYILGLESTSNRMFGIGKSELLLNKIYEPREVLEKIDMISMDDANRIIKNVFGCGIISAAAVGKINKKFNLERLLSNE